VIIQVRYNMKTNKNKILKMSRNQSLLQNVRKQGIILWHEIIYKFNPYMFYLLWLVPLGYYDYKKCLPKVGIKFVSHLMSECYFFAAEINYVLLT